MITVGALVLVNSGMEVGSSSPGSVAGVLVGSIMMAVGEIYGSSGSVGACVGVDVTAGRTHADKINIEKARNITFILFIICLFIEIT
jgi:hypothetical protein